MYCDIWRKIADRYKNEPIILGYELFNEPIAPYFPNMEELNGNFKPFKDSKFDDKIMYTCHRYGGDPTKEAIQSIIDFRDKVNLPMYMGEIGHNTDEWQPLSARRCVRRIGRISFISPRLPVPSYKEIRDARPNQVMARKAMMDFIEACKLKNCVVQEGYIQSLGMKQ